MPWKPGQSGNPGGRPRGLAARVREIVDVDELVNFALNLLRDERASMRDRCWAVDFLADRGFGKPTQTMDLRAELRAYALPPTWPSMSPAERRAYLDQVQARALGPASE